MSDEAAKPEPDEKLASEGLLPAPSPGPQPKPLPRWVPVLGVILAGISATFAGLNYFKVPKARATIVVDRFADMQIKMPFGDAGEKNMHSLRMWVTNTGQSPARIKNVAISPEPYDELLTPEREAQRMELVSKNKNMIGTSVDTEITSGQKVFFPSHAGFPDEHWSKFINKKEYFYIFAVVTFTDELSGNSEVTTEFCARLEPDLNNWNHCASGHNRTNRR